MDGKRVFVTGGAKGIGAAIVTAFCNVGARVAFCDTDEKAASRLCDLLPTFVQFFQADASDPEARFHPNRGTIRMGFLVYQRT